MHQQIQRHINPALFDHAPRLPHMETMKYSDPILTEIQLQCTLQRLLQLNLPAPTAPAAPLVADANTSNKRPPLT